ncbi:cell adhesion molecule Dscam1-like [Nomia melanderi]|uniref:cell adhesion molecule Dscam1-like n=1 Tax=Nomia melanderi TaxID=2448451 RepID=UPI003FCD4C63
MCRECVELIPLRRILASGMNSTVLLFLLTAYILDSVVGQQGPVFVLEPPSTLVFSNTTGSQLSCSAHGSPTPHVTWITSPDQRSVTAVPGLRQLLGNGTLYFPPFLAQDFRAEVHNARYRCRATSSVGTVLSREVTLRAVIKIYHVIHLSLF